MPFGLNQMPVFFAMELGELLPVFAKVFNLLLFAGVMYLVLRRPLAEAFRARQEGIRRDLMRAEEERRAAVEKLQEVEARLANLDSEVASISEHDAREVAAQGV